MKTCPHKHFFVAAFFNFFVGGIVLDVVVHKALQYHRMMMHHYIPTVERRVESKVEGRFASRQHMNLAASSGNFKIIILIPTLC